MNLHSNSRNRRNGVIVGLLLIFDCVVTFTTSLTFIRATTTSNSKYNLRINPKTELSCEKTNNNIHANEPYDLIVIGGGPVGVRAAIVAATSPHDKKVLLVDAPKHSGALYNEKLKEDLSIGGPTGLFSKALRDTSKRISVTTLRGMGLREDNIWNEVMTSCVELASANARDVRRQLEFSNVDLIEGLASFTGKGNGDDAQHVEIKVVTTGDDDVDGSKEEMYISSKYVLLATGSKPYQPEGIPFDKQRVFDSDSINQLSYLPKSIAITGSGIIAIEYAKIFRNLGAAVTLIIRDKVPRNALMKIGFDKDIAASLVADLVRSGIKFERGKQVKDFDVPIAKAAGNARGPIKLTLGDVVRKNVDSSAAATVGTAATSELLCDAYLAAVGRVPCGQNTLNLPALNIEADSYGGIIVQSSLSTSHPRVYAAGDVLGRPFLASTGVAQGVAAVQAIFDPYVLEKNSFSCVEEDSGNGAEEFLCIDGDLSTTGAKFDPKSLASNPFAFPVGVWSSPEASWYGLTTDQAKEFNIDAGEGIALYAECLRGQVFSPNGLLKIVFEKSSYRIIGIHIVGEDACELIHYGMELVRSKRTLQDVVGNLYSAVTFHEMYRIAAMAGLDEKAARWRRRAAGAALAARNRSLLAGAN